MTVAFSHVSIDETVTPDLTDIFMGASVRQGWLSFLNPNPRDRC